MYHVICAVLKQSDRKFEHCELVVWVHEYSIMLLYVFVCHDVMSSLKATVSWEVWQCQLSQNKEEDDIPAEIYASIHLCCCVCVCESACE